MGLGLGRVRHRAGLAEFTLGDVVVADGDVATARRVLRGARRAGVDHVSVHAAAGTELARAALASGYVTVPGQGIGLVVNRATELPDGGPRPGLLAALPRGSRGVLMRLSLPAFDAATAVAVSGVVIIASYVTLTAWAATGATYEVWSALLFIPLLLLVSLPMLARAGARDPDPRFIRLLVLAFVLKCFSTVARYLMAFVLYDGVADASLYDTEGERLAEQYRDGNFDAEIGRRFVGTGFIRVFTGAIYTVTGPSIYVGYAVYGWLGFWGLYFLYRAFRVAVPDGDAHRYALLVLFLPSMLFWPSGLGKEAFMTFGRRAGRLRQRPPAHRLPTVAAPTGAGPAGDRRGSAPHHGCSVRRPGRRLVPPPSAAPGDGADSARLLRRRRPGGSCRGRGRHPGR